MRFLVGWLLLGALLAGQSAAVSYSVPFVSPGSCATGFYFDSSSLSCIKCPTASPSNFPCLLPQQAFTPCLLPMHAGLLPDQGWHGVSAGALERARFPDLMQPLCCRVQCDTTSGFYYATDQFGFGISMNYTPSSASSTGCSCPATSMSTTPSVVFANGALRQRCVTCPPGFVVDAVSTMVIVTGA